MKYGPPVWERSYADRGLTEWSLVILLEVKAANDAHIWLNASEDPKSKSKAMGYEIVLGANGNSNSFIRRGQQGDELAARMEQHGSGPLNRDKAEKFWISYNRIMRKGKPEVRIYVGRGLTVGSSAFLPAVCTKARNVHSVSLSTGYGAEGDWTILSVQVRSNDTPDEPREIPVKRVNVTPVKSSIVVKRSTEEKGSALLKRPRITSNKSPNSEKTRVDSSERERKLLEESVDNAIAKFK